MKQLPLTLGLLAFCLAASPLAAQDQAELQEKYDTIVEEDWVAHGSWILDYETALAQAKKEGKYVFAYFSRSYAPWPPCISLENGPLSSKEFAKFTKTAVPYLNLTNHIEGRPEDAIAKEHGVRGFPTLMFLDANGKEVAKPSNRSTEGFDSTLSDIKALDDLRARISNGEKGLEASCLLREMNLGAVGFEDANQRRGSLKKPKMMKSKVWKETLANIDGKMVDLEVDHLLKSAGRDRDKRNALNEQFYEMAKDGKTVTGSLIFPYWSGAMTMARENKDAEVFEKALNALEEAFGSNPRARADLDKWKAELEGMGKITQAEATAPQTVVLAVTGMTWGVSCVGKVNRALASLPWVEKHAVNFAGKSATITVNAKYDASKTIKAINSAGFGASIL